MRPSLTPERLHALSRHEPGVAASEVDGAREPARVRRFPPTVRRIPRAEIADPSLRPVLDACRSALGPTGRSGPVILRGAASAGGRYPIELSLLSHEGLARYCPVTDLLTPVRGSVTGDGLTIGISAVAERTTWRYGPLAYRQLLWDAGAAIATLVLRCRDAALPVRVHAGITGADEVLAVPDGEIALAIIEMHDPGGRGALAHPGRSARCGELAAADAAENGDVHLWHRLTSLPSTDDALAWRAAHPALDAVVPPTREDRVGPLSAAIGVRRSQAPAPSSPLDARTWHRIAADADAGVVFDVPEVTAGVHIDDELGQRGSFRRAVDRLCLTPRISGRSSAVAFICLPPDAVTDGPDYRAHQLHIGARLAIMQLTATAAAHPATPLTLFERCAQDAIGTPGEPQLALAIS